MENSEGGSEKKKRNDREGEQLRGKIAAKLGK